MGTIYVCDRCADRLSPPTATYYVVLPGTGRRVDLCAPCRDVLARICDAFMEENERYRRPGRHEFEASVKDLLSGTRYDVDKSKHLVRAYADRFKMGDTNDEPSELREVRQPEAD